MPNCTQPQYDFKIYCYLILFSISLVFPLQILSMEAVGKANQFVNTQENTWAFKLKNNKTGQELNLLGTGHAIPFSKLPLAVQRLVQNTNILLGEIPDITGFKEYADKVGFDSTSAYRQLDFTIRNRIEKELKSAGKSERLNSLSRMKPWLIYMQVMQIVEGRKYQKGMDLEIMSIVGKRNKGLVIPLETLSERIEAMGIRKMSIEECQNSLFELFQSEYSNGESSVDNAYLSDLETLYNIMSPALSHPELVGMLKNRNDLWLKKLPSILTSVQYKANQFQNPIPLIAVGAAHLLGKDGLLVRLSQMGYTINRYCKNGELMPYSPIS